MMRRLMVALAFAVCAAPASAAAAPLIGKWRGVRQLEDGKPVKIDPRLVVVFEFRRGGIFESFTTPPHAKKPLRRTGTWKIRKGRLHIDLPASRRQFRYRATAKRLELRELPDRKRLFVLVRLGSKGS